MYAMAQPIPTAVPDFFVSGDTVKWQISLSEYPASDGWVLKYRLINAISKLDLTAAASGADHLITLTASATAGYPAGKYIWQGYVEKAAERYTVGSGSIEVRPDLAAKTSGYDSRSSAKRALDAMNSALEVYGQKAYVQSYEVAGRTMTFKNNGEFLAFRSRLQVEVRGEEAAARIAAGLSPRNKIHVRFGGG